MSLKVTAEDARVLRLGFDGEASAPRAVRRAFATHFAAHPSLEVLLLLLSEVVTNAVLHARTGGAVTAAATDDGVRVEVSDGSTSRPVRRPFTEMSPTGRGLHLLDRLATSWGIDDVAAGGKVVWFEVAEGRGR